MTPDQAITTLSEATQPQAAGRITREGYAQIEQALAVVVGLKAEVERLRALVEKLEKAQGMKWAG